MMKKSQFFFIHLLLSAVRYSLLFLASVVLGIIGLFGVSTCLYIGWALLALYAILCVIATVRMEKLVSYRSEDNFEFNELMDRLTDDPNSVLAEIMEEQNRNRDLHGEALLALSDEDLFETVYFQVMEIADDRESGKYDPKGLSKAQETVYVLATFDSEIQNGGLCQFFVNSSREVAPMVSECLTAVGAEQHRSLYENFVRECKIDLSDLSSFKIKRVREYFKQTKRYDYDSFDDAYGQLPLLQDRIVAYIRDNISQF